jgi:hypothetical protein
VPQRLPRDPSIFSELTRSDSSTLRSQRSRPTRTWSQGIRGADFFISAIGPAFSVFGKYERLTKFSGEEVTAGQFLDEARGLVTGYALAKILKTTHTANIDPETRFYVVWKWSCGDPKVPADESFKLAQALGMDTGIMWDRTGVLETSGENVQAASVARRTKIKDLGERMETGGRRAEDGGPNPPGGRRRAEGGRSLPSSVLSPPSLIDVLHRMCAFRGKGDPDGMANFLARSTRARTLRSGSSPRPSAKSCRTATKRNKGGLQELEETDYWLELLGDSGKVKSQRLAKRRQETGELLAILASCAKSAKTHRKRTP